MPKVTNRIGKSHSIAKEKSHSSDVKRRKKENLAKSLPTKEVSSLAALIELHIQESHLVDATESAVAIE